MNLLNIECVCAGWLVKSAKGPYSRFYNSKLSAQSFHIYHLHDFTLCTNLKLTAQTPPAEQYVAETPLAEQHAAETPLAEQHAAQTPLAAQHAAGQDAPGGAVHGRDVPCGAVHERDVPCGAVHGRDASGGVAHGFRKLVRMCNNCFTSAGSVKSGIRSVFVQCVQFCTFCTLRPPPARVVLRTGLQGKQTLFTYYGRKCELLSSLQHSPRQAAV